MLAARPITFGLILAVAVWMPWSVCCAAGTVSQMPDSLPQAAMPSCHAPAESADFTQVPCQDHDCQCAGQWMAACATPRVAWQAPPTAAMDHVLNLLSLMQAVWVALPVNEQSLAHLLPPPDTDTRTASPNAMPSLLVLACQLTL